jgi:DNA-binding transcriptional ArsR family regulator
VLSVAAALRASAGFADLSWTELQALHWLSIENGLSVDELAQRLALSAGNVSRALTSLADRGLVSEELCTARPEGCPRLNGSHGNRVHHLQWLTDAGRAVAEEWEEPFVKVLVGMPVAKWLSTASQFRQVSRRQRRLTGGR